VIKFNKIKVVVCAQMLKIVEDLKHFEGWSITALFCLLRQRVVVIRYKKLPLHAT